MVSLLSLCSSCSAISAALCSSSEAVPGVVSMHAASWACFETNACSRCKERLGQHSNLSNDNGGAEEPVTLYREDGISSAFKKPHSCAEIVKKRCHAIDERKRIPSAPCCTHSSSASTTRSGSLDLAISSYQQYHVEGLRGYFDRSIESADSTVSSVSVNLKLIRIRNQQAVEQSSEEGRSKPAECTSSKK